ncbi:hypothetical protein ACFYWN_00415 [Streptomyces sp. NPDC002917]|uniref:hypothetical protein n=1 Tax=Streptomyces sp. NPDC002917 TaxID=3364671 RepID=UPI003679EA10
MTLDLFIVAGELMMLRAALLRRVDLWAIGLTVAGSGGSIALNVAGVGSHADPLNYVVAEVPPTAALLAFGALMRQVHQALAGHVAPAADPAAAELPAEVTVERAYDEQLPAAVEPVEVVMPPVAELEFRPLVWPPRMTDEPTTKVTAAVPAETARQVVTETVTVQGAHNAWRRRGPRAAGRGSPRRPARPRAGLPVPDRAHQTVRRVLHPRTRHHPDDYDARLDVDFSVLADDDKAAAA